MSYLPTPILYGLSRIIYCVLLLSRYRYRIIQKNLIYAFPSINSKERKQYQKKFYQNFADYIVEVVLTLSKNDVYMKQHHVKFINSDILYSSYHKNKEIFILLAHNFNWEWISFLTKSIPQKKVNVIYKILKNKKLNALIEKTRLKSGAIGIPTHSVFKTINNGDYNKDNSYVFLVDQSPKAKETLEYTTFFNKKTAVYTGYEQLIINRNADVYYLDIKKEGRGKYLFSIEPILPDGEQFKKMEVVEKYYRCLEKAIKNDPPNWLWSHKRWKHTPSD